MYDFVIVPYDNTDATRVGHAPAADLAWRCKAKLVMVANSQVADRSSQRTLKGQAMDLSGDGDVDFWVDTEARSLGHAVASAGRYRGNACICVLAKPTGFLMKKGLDPLAEDVLRDATVPVVVLGPKFDLTARMPVGRIIACLDGTPQAEKMMPIVATWAVQLRLNVSVVGVLGPGGTGPAELTIDYLKEHAFSLQAHIDAELADIPFGLPTVQAELLEAASPAMGLVGVATDEGESILAMCMHSNASKPKGVVGDVAMEVLKESPRPVLLIPGD